MMKNKQTKYEEKNKQTSKPNMMEKQTNIQTKYDEKTNKHPNQI